MQTATQSDYLSVEDYLAAEEASEVRHEYLGGFVYAKAGETRAHNAINLNLATAIRQHLRGGPCKVYMSDTEAMVFRRAKNWRAEKTVGVDASLSLSCLQLTIPFSAVYEGL